MTGVLTDRLGQGTLGRPAKQEPALKGVSPETEQARPFGNGVTFSAKINHPVVAPVVGLNLFGRPAAVVAGVGAVTVNAVNALSLGAQAHVRKERLEARGPRLAHGDAAATIRGVALNVGIEAARFRRTPGTVFAGPRLVMLQAALTASLIVETTAAIGQTGKQASADDICGVAAGAQATPRSPLPKARLLGRTTDDSQSSESPTREINRNRAHRSDYNRRESR